MGLFDRRPDYDDYLESCKFVSKGNSYIDRKQYEEAINCFDIAISFYEKNDTAWLNKAFAFNNLGRYEEALKCCEKALSANPKNMDASYYIPYYIGKASSLNYLGRYEEALKSCERAFSLNPQTIERSYNIEYYCEKTLSLTNLGRYEEALKSCEKWLSFVHSKPPLALNMKCTALFHLERYEEALQCCNESLDLEPNDDVTLHNKDKILSVLREKRIEKCDFELNNSKLKQTQSSFENAKKIHCYDKDSRQVEPLKDDRHPLINAAINENYFKSSIGKKTHIVLKNKGDIVAKNIYMRFEGNLDIRVLSDISHIEPSDEILVDLWLKSTEIGDCPLDIFINYQDELDREYEDKKVIILHFTDDTTVNSQSIENNVATSKLLSKSNYTTSFPSEISDLYCNPEIIGSGGFARVFRGTREDGTTVALKLPLTFDETTGKSFLREIVAWEKLSHENIIKLYKKNIMPIPYLELEYAENGSLEDVPKPIEKETAAKIVFDISEGLKYAHEQGIIHRDLKPQNVLLTKDMTPKITDWGLSKVMAESKTSSKYGYSPLYAAPELLSSKKFGKPDRRTDIYQLGVIFYELLTGKLPFEGEDVSEIMFTILSEEAEPPSYISPKCGELDDIIMKCLNKQQNRRYYSVSEFQKSLANYLEIKYKKSLKKSSGNLRRSCFYCGNLVEVHAKIGNVEEALKYAINMKNYAGKQYNDQVEDIINRLDYCVERKQPVGDKLLAKIGVILHQVKMGR